MALLPEGFALPPLPHLLVLLASVVVVGGVFARRRPVIEARHVVALVPWMGVGAAVHVLYVVDALPALVRPFGGTPAVYVSVAVIAGATWLVVSATNADLASGVGLLGSVALVTAVAATLGVGLGRGTLSLFWPTVGVLVGVLVAVVVWGALRRGSPAAASTGSVGAIAVFAHVLDGVSTAVGVDALGFGERTPLSQLIIEFAAGLPTEPILGTVWLFVLVKIAVVSLLVVTFAEYVQAEPSRGNALLGLVAAVGLGPGIHNLLLFAVA